MKNIDQFHALMDSLEAIVYVADMDTYEVLFINRYGRDLLGDIAGQLCWKSIQAGQRGPCEFCTNKYLLDEGGQPREVYTWEFQNTVTGRWFLIKDRAIEWIDGRIVRLEIATDITERKQTEERLRESEEKFRAIVETTSEWIWSCDAQGIHTYSNDSIRSILGYEPEEMIGMSAFNLLHPDDSQRAAENVKNAMAKRQGWSGLVLRWKHKDGTYRFLESTASPIIGSDGAVLGWNGADRDITDRKLAEEKLRKSEEEYRDLFEGASDMIQVVLPDGQLRYVNPSWRKTFGYSPEEAATLSVFDLIAGDCVGHCQDTFRCILTEGAVDQFEATFLSKDGRRILIEGSATCKYENGVPVYAQCILRDVTERKKAEEGLREAKRKLELQNEELKKLDRMKDSLLRDVSHELKTPVAKHAMQLEILAPLIESLQMNEQQAKAFQVMRENVRRQEGVIRNLLDLARLESKGRVYNRQKVTLDSIISKVRSDYQDIADDHGVDLDVNVPPLVVHGDSEMLWHVFSNIIDNAIKFRRGDEPSKISVTAELRDGNVLIQVSDSGIGLEKSEVPKLLKRFYQASPSTEGSGVGLAISRRIVEDHGGKIWVDSEGLGKGATVSVMLPQADSRKEDAAGLG